MLQQTHAKLGARLQHHAALGFVNCFDMDSYIGRRSEACRFFRPFCQFEAGAGKNIAKASVFPFAGVVKAVEVKVRNHQARYLVRLDHRVSGAFDAASHAHCAQQVAHQGGFARPQVAVQREVGIAHLRQRCQRRCKGLRIVLVVPVQHALGVSASYNRGVMVSSSQLVPSIQAWARELGFSQIGISGVDLSDSEPGLLQWLAQGFHGEMHYMQSHGLKRARPAELVPGTLSVITARMNYLPAATPQGWQQVEWQRLQRPQEGIISVYARGRDYHKVLRSRLQKLAERIAQEVGPLGHRAFTDSAPVLEAELARRSGQGWRGKHTLVLNRDAGSMFFLGEIFVDMALPETAPTTGHCGQCSACITACPTGAIVAPQQVDARRCISYLTIEHAEPIPLELRPLLANRIYGCDDCQLACPWNKFAQRSTLPDFDARAPLVGVDLVYLLAWSEAEFLQRTEGSPIRRIGHERWLRNIAVALGNALRASTDAAATAAMRHALTQRLAHPSALVQEHVQWALAQAPA